MPHHQLDISFATLATSPEAVSVAFSANDLAMGKTLQGLNTKSGGAVLKSAQAADFKGKSKQAIELLAPPKLDLNRLIIVGVGKADEAAETDWTMLGGAALAQANARKAESASLIAEIPQTCETKPEVLAALLGYGALLRHYTFRKYKTKKPGEDDKTNDSASTSNGIERLVIHCADPNKARAAFERYQAIAAGINMARDLVNEPANTLGPVEFAERARELEEAGCEVEILGVDEMRALKMELLLCVGQGSRRPSRLAIMRWNGAKSKRAKPLCFVGKGVVFDSGGLSIKPSSGMEGMKGDMGGAACVTGLMLALAGRKANVNAVGLIGLVENMPDGDAVRPGDIVTSMSGQTVEILNTDAEGRLVLGDVLWYAQDRFKPKLIIDLATLTGAVMIALGKDYAGLFANDDKLSADLLAASKATGEKIWRMPLDKSFHKLIDTPNADMKNLGGRWAGSCTAAAFLERFIKDTPWAHLDIAGTAMDGKKTDVNTSWGPGWGVRLLDTFVANHHEKGDK